MWSTTALLLVLFSIGVSTSDVNSDVIVEKFLDRMMSSIKSKDESIISGLFEPEFILKGCKGIYDKKKIIEVLEKIPSDSKFSFSLKSSEDLGSIIKYSVSISGFDKDDGIVEFILNKKDQQLESGRVPACQPKIRRARHPIYALAVTRANVFFNQFKKAVMSRDMVGLEKLIDENFKFSYCSGQTFDKAALLDKLKRVDTENPFDYEIQSAEYNSKNRQEIECVVEIYGVSSDFTAKFVVNHKKKLVISGASNSCKK